ncbi:MAG: CapA family protein, partial [Euryarchaeota archaeon]|nr:CapA family protein [Euryarchaeota archaeon]
GIDYVSLANNHALDFSKEGLLEMLDLLEENGIAYAGAGRNIEEARKPALLKAKGIRVAVYALTDNEPSFAAGSASPGTNYIPITLEEKYFQKVREGIEAARRLTDIVVVSAHWGPNMVARPPSSFRAFARAVVDAGADIFHGHSAHIFQGVEIYRGKPILYDTGDFVDDYYVGDEKNDQSSLFLLTASRRRVERIELFPALISRCQVNRAQRLVFDEIYGRMRGLSLEMGTRVERRGDRLLVATSALSSSPSSSQG